MDAPPPVDAKRTNFSATVLAQDADWYGPPGALASFGQGQIRMACPGCGWISGMRVGNPKPTEAPSWCLTGDAEKPETVSLHPSINCISCCAWHGHLKEGVYTSC